MSGPTLEGCKAYAGAFLAETLMTYDLVDLQRSANIINNICFEMGCLCRHDKARYQNLAYKLAQTIDSITTDLEVRIKLDKYANRLIDIARHYLMLTEGY